MEKCEKNNKSELVSHLYLILVNSPKYGQCIQENLLEIRY